MKLFWRAGIAAAVLAAALSTSALAADYTDCAERLNDMGLFRGTQQGFELDRAPTRAEAAVMLVRLLGKEEEALTLAYQAPFTDLDTWVQPYVQYLYENGLTTGATATTFEPKAACTSQMYAAFLLRALGYTEQAGDYSYAQAQEFAEQKQVYDNTVIDYADFLRDDVAAASYAALCVAPKNGSASLLHALIASGAVEQTEVTASYDTLFSTYQSYLSATDKMKELTALQLRTHMETPTAIALGDSNLFFSSEEIASIDLAGANSLTNRIITLSAENVGEKTLSSQSYLAGKRLYLNFNGQQSYRDLNDLQSSRMNGSYAVLPIALIDRITERDSSFEITYNTAGLERLDSLLYAAETAVGDGAELSLDSVKITQTVENGFISTQQLDAVWQNGAISIFSVLEKTNDQVSVAAPQNLNSYLPEKNI